jgi:hypothetical protein
MPVRVRLVHSKAAEAWPRVEQLSAAGYEVDYDADTEQVMQSVKAAMPSAIVIDLSRAPSHGLEMALFFRQRKSTRQIPLVLVDGEPDKVAKLEKALPGAVFTGWSRIRTALRSAIANPPPVPVESEPAPATAGYSAVPLPKKLGILAGTTVVLVDAPPGFERTLGVLPEGVSICRKNCGAREMTLWFVTSLASLERGITWMKAAVGTGSLWAVWPKKTSRMASDLGESDVRRVGLGAGLVDYKVCAIDDNWSGLKFTRRKTDKTEQTRQQ